MTENEISSIAINAAIEVDKTLGPGLLESSYEICLLLNFNVKLLKEGIKRIVNRLN